jgi:RNA polymerase sigma-70 factor (ECF subfamily)
MHERDAEAAARSRRRTELMAAAQHGDREAYRALLEDVSPLVTAVLRRRISDPAELADVHQEALVHLHRARHTYDPKRPFDPWLFAIVRHTAIDHARRRRVRLSWEVLVDEPPEQVAETTAADRQALEHALAGLPASQREAFEMLQVEGLSVDAAAERAGVSRGALKVRAHRAYKALRALFATRS